MNQFKANILVVEDDPAILNGLLDVLVFNGYDAKGVEDGHQGLQQGLSGRFDLILLDVMLPDMDGFSICEKIRQKMPGQAVIMLTAKGAEDDVVTGFKAGADDYISKPFSLRELMVRIEAILRRSGKMTGSERLVFNEVVFDGKNLQAKKGQIWQDLTRREMDIIVYLYNHSDRIVSKKELLTNVWHYKDADIETRTVDIHILKLRKKITSLGGNTPSIKTIRGEGYRLENTE